MGPGRESQLHKQAGHLEAPRNPQTSHPIKLGLASTVPSCPSIAIPVGTLTLPSVCPSYTFSSQGPGGTTYWNVEKDPGLTDVPTQVIQDAA